MRFRLKDVLLALCLCLFFSLAAYSQSNYQIRGGVDVSAIYSKDRLITHQGEFTEFIIHLPVN